MKYVLLLLLIFITGCNHENLYINQELVKNIKYDNINLIDADFENIIDEINLTKFKKGKLTGEFTKSLLVTTNNDFYIFNIGYNGIKYTKDNTDYFTDNLNLLKALEEVEQKYNQSFYTIESVMNYDIGSDEDYIKLDSNNNYFILNASTTLYDFRINQLESDDAVFQEVNLLYAIDKLETNKIVIRSSENIKITFKNLYNFETIIIPYNDNGKISFKTSYNQKK